jgi:hypothetical protein
MITARKALLLVLLVIGSVTAIQPQVRLGYSQPFLPGDGASTDPEVIYRNETAVRLAAPNYWDFKSLEGRTMFVARGKESPWTV